MNVDTTTWSVVTIRNEPNYNYKKKIPKVTIVFKGQHDAQKYNDNVQFYIFYVNYFSNKNL